MSLRTRIIVAGLTLLLFSGAVLAQYQADQIRPSLDTDQELLYLPNEKLLTHFTGGMSSIVADMLWLRCVSYVALQAKGEGSFEWLNHMVNTVVRLDPHFVDAYRWGGMFLASLKADDDAAVDLLERGIILNPDAWELPYELAMIYLMNRREEPGSKKQAAVYLSMSVATGNASLAVERIAEKLQEQYDLTEIERDMWNEMLKSPDTLLRETAVKKLKELDIRETCKLLDERYRQFVAQTGAPPAHLGQLGLKDTTDAFGGRFFIDNQGQVQNTTILDNKKQWHGNLIRVAINRYHEEFGTYPPDLDTLVMLNLMSIIPEQPYPGEDWIYDPTTGTLK